MNENVQSVFIRKTDYFDLEFIVDEAGELTLYVDCEDTDGTLSSDKVISKTELKYIIDGLANIYDELHNSEEI